MRPNRLRRLLILAAFGAIAAGSGIGTGIAKATPEDTTAKAVAICDILDNLPYLTTVDFIGSALVADGMTYDAAGDLIRGSVAVFCPWNQRVMDHYTAMYGHVAPVVKR